MTGETETTATTTNSAQTAAAAACVCTVTSPPPLPSRLFRPRRNARVPSVRSYLCCYARAPMRMPHGRMGRPRPAGRFMNLMRSRARYSSPPPSLKFAAPLLCGANFIPIVIVVSRRGSLAIIYRAWNKGMQILVSNSQADPGRTAKQEQEEISRNHVQAFIPGSVC